MHVRPSAVTAAERKRRGQKEVDVPGRGHAHARAQSQHGKAVLTAADLDLLYSHTRYAW
jgi:hypothetical protein